MLNLESYLERASALELAKRSLISAPAYAAISLIMLLGTPILMNYGAWAVAEASLLLMLAVVRVWFAHGFADRYDKIGERAVMQFSVLTAVQSLTLGILAATIIWYYWSTQEAVLTIVLAAGSIAAGTSALSVRRSAHIIFLICVLLPFGIAVYLVGGLAKALLILGFLVLMAFLVQDGGLARRSYLQNLESHYKEELNQRRMELESEAKKKFLLDIGHELRTPVNSIIGLTTLLLDEELDTTTREYAKIIRESCNALRVLVESGPGAARFTPVSQDLEIGSVNLRRCINRVLELYRPETSRKGVGLTSTVTELPDIINFCAEDHLEQVLTILLGNAVQFTESGQISLAASCQNPGEGLLMVEFSITDSGPGIPENLLASIFDPFQPADAEGDARMNQGGLGLPLCSGLVESMGGQIQIDSSEGQGTVVTFTIRAGIDPSATSSGEEAQAETGLPGETDIVFPDDLSLEYPHNILVVDDDDIHRKIMCVHLAKMGYQADVAEDGQEAIAAVMKGHYDLIFMDVSMPNMGGIQANQWIREHFNTVGDLRVIALTGDATQETRDECLNTGMDQFIPKPLQIENLLTVLRYKNKPRKHRLHTETAKADSLSEKNDVRASSG